MKLAKVSQLLYVPRRWASFRIHNLGKSVLNDDQCYPDMLRVYQREVGRNWLSWLRLRFIARRLLYAWLPWRLRLRLRKAIS